MIPVSSVSVTEAQRRLVNEVLDSGHLVQGPVVERLEACGREMTGAAHAIAVSSGTSALELAFEAVQLGPGDEVIISPFTFVATLNAALQSGADVRFADISEIDFTIDPDALRAAMTDAVRVVTPVHLYGLAADIDAVRSIAAHAGALIIEDAAQAHGATFDGRPVGTAGLAAFSFYATKNVFAGEGGLVTTDDDDLADVIRILRNQGMRARYDYDRPGHNHRMTDLAAAVAVPQFDTFHDAIAARRRNASLLSEGLADIDGLVLPATPDRREHVWHQYTVRVTAAARVSRNELISRLADRGVGSGIYYPAAVYDYQCFRDHPRVEVGEGCPVAERVATEVVSLPVHQQLAESDVEQVIDAVRAVLS